MTKQRTAELNQLAKDLVYSGNTHFDDGISMCVYVSKCFGIELTIGEIETVEQMIEEIELAVDEYEYVKAGTYENNECPDCNTPLPVPCIAGTSCENCTHVFNNLQPCDGEQCEHCL